MRIGFITADLSHKHGWAHYSLELIEALRKHGVQTCVVTASNTPPVGFTHTPILPPLVPRARALLPRLLAQAPRAARVLYDCDLIHTTVEPFAPLGALVAGRRPLVVSGVGSYLRIDAWQRPPVSTIYRQAIARAHVIAISHYTAQVARETFPQVPVDVVPLGIDAARFTHLTRRPNPARPTIITVGGVKPRKGTLPLVRAMPRVRQAYPNVRCIVIGSTAGGSDYTREVRAEIERYNLHDTVTLTGFLPEAELMRWYETADLFVLPSMNVGWTFEGYGLVHMEASAAGLPVIGTRGCGVEDAVDDGITGLLVSQEQIDDELPDAIIRLLGDAAQRARMGRAGRERAARQSWHTVAGQMLPIYRHLLER